jgi:mRNA interferase MazF
MRGEIWQVDLGMIGKIRPVLILSIAYQDNERAVISYVPRTTSPRGTRFEVGHQQRGMKPGVFEAQMIGTAPDATLMRKMGVVGAETLIAVEDAVKAWLGLV